MTQDYTGPDGESRTRHGILARVRVEDFDAGQVLPHERTLPGPKKDRLDLTRATRHNLSPIFSLATADPWPLVAPAIEGQEPWGEATDESGTVTRVWRVGDPEVHAAVHELLDRRPAADRRRPPPLRDRDRLPRRGRRRGRPQLHADGADRARRPRPHRLPHPPPALRHRRRPRAPAGARQRAARALRRHRGRRPTELDPLGEEGVGVFGLYDSHHGRGFRLRLKDSAIAALDEELAGKPEAYRRLDAAILETLVLKGIAGLSEEDILAKRGIGYSKSVEDSLALIEDGTYDAAFILRPIPVDQVRRSAKATRTCRRSRPTSSPRS